MLIGGLDIGTSGCKITVYNEKGDFIEKQYREYASKHAQDVHEIDAEAIYQAVGDVDRQQHCAEAGGAGGDFFRGDLCAGG